VLTFCSLDVLQEPPTLQAAQALEREHREACAFADLHNRPHPERPEGPPPAGTDVTARSEGHAALQQLLRANESTRAMMATPETEDFSKYGVLEKVGGGVGWLVGR
jgi:hypothetical protein